MTRAAWPLGGSATEKKMQDKPIEQKSLGANSEPPGSFSSGKERALPTELEGQGAEDTIVAETPYPDRGVEVVTDKASDKENQMPKTSLNYYSLEDSSSKKPEAKTSEEGSEQKSFVGITRENTNSSSDSDEDLLDIPAFLRRQAN